MVTNEGELQGALAKARQVAGWRLRNGADCDDAVQNAYVRLLRAVESGEQVDSVCGFLVSAVDQEALLLLRQRRQRRDREVPEPQAVGAGEGLDGLRDRAATIRSEVLVSLLLVALAEPLRGWLGDFLSGASVAELARRDDVDVASIRKRRSRLGEAILAMPEVQDFLEFSVTFGRFLHPRAGVLGSDPPNPEPRTPDRIMNADPRSDLSSLVSKFLAWIFVLSFFSLSVTAQQASQQPSCWCTLLIRLHDDVWEKKCSPSQCLDGEGWCAEGLINGRAYCNCSMSENENGWPTSCICTGAAAINANPPVVCYSLQSCAVVGMPPICDVSHWWSFWGVYTEVCRCN